MTSTAPEKLTVVKVEDHEGNGICRNPACGREGLRWIVTLSDGTQVGTECVKRILGISIPRRVYDWTPGFRPVAEHMERGAGACVAWVLWEHKDHPAATRMTRNGHLVQVGGARQEWAKRGWAA